MKKCEDRGRTTFIQEMKFKKKKKKEEEEEEIGGKFFLWYSSRWPACNSVTTIAV